MSLSEETVALQRAAHELMYLGMDGSPIYSDDLSRRNGEVYRLTAALYDSGAKGATIEEQANVCLALLMGYSASFIDHGEKQKRIQEILDRCWDILDVLPVSLLKLRLLTACYGEVFDEPLADEGRAIIFSWNSVSLTTEQREAIEEFQNVVDNPYPWEYIEDSASEEVDVKYIKSGF
ncbi:UpxZ family transcription anti-terminator antagonist [Bacteroides cellulosilyticus]|uniref:UpxZ family transcription anti-terminator antagonist n=1 Tax=Bacteroides cellulosilyticus TaxID=246787 RepID=UPI001C37D313|nr:UpxZ family transcription anti-terminator antagonist [Bacteroides cellulosilyticus]MBV3639758.1 UpxZ family transcription anti-terminator antagonist [Bacteroides cellulosilyticus]MBV3665779.1 UpxZ family transcription anti-terminator antagonist [Bacteroides cellulosilyticus]MBV3687259.1 UpxZ family transcription anti-terminator antagonist [Bacteroides cellulosilyticus]MBV3696603.1 UpxZ family transcription anti-terminator antagonist [Bacteroides cellulosilyticus]MBV3710169.1 UpxZ family tra